MPECRRDEAVAGHGLHPAAATARDSRMPLHVVESAGHRELVGLSNLATDLSVAEPERDAHALGGGKGEIEAGDARAAVRRGERITGARARAVEHCVKVVVLDLAAHP